MCPNKISKDELYAKTECYSTGKGTRKSRKWPWKKPLMELTWGMAKREAKIEFHGKKGVAASFSMYRIRQR